MTNDVRVPVTVTCCETVRSLKMYLSVILPVPSFCDAVPSCATVPFCKRDAQVVVIAAVRVQQHAPFMTCVRLEVGEFGLGLLGDSFSLGEFCS